MHLSTSHCVSIQNVTDVSDNSTVSIPTLKRKRSDEIESDESFNKVSSSQKRACMISHSELVECSDHSYFIKSPCRTRRQVDYLTDKIENLTKKVNSSQKKTKQRDKKVSTLAAVVSELKDKNLINNDCANMLETTFSGVSKKLMKRLVGQKKRKNLGAYPPEL